MDDQQKRHLELSEVFKNYVVDDTPEHWKYLPGMIIAVAITPSDYPGDYDCNIVCAVKLKKNLHRATFQIHDIMTNGRCMFQELVEDFEIMQQDEDGAFYVNFQELYGCYCIVAANSRNQTRALSATEYEVGDEKEQKIIDLFKQNAEFEEMIGLAAVPEEVLYYRMIPMTEPYDSWLPDTEYHACIKEISVEASDRGKDYNVKVSAYVFNGNHTKVMASYFNGIHGRAKRDFDAFCHEFDLVNEDGSVSVKDAVGHLCSVDLYENSKGNLYIDHMQQLDVTDEEIKHYALILKRAKAFRKR